MEIIGVLVYHLHPIYLRHPLPFSFYHLHPFSFSPLHPSSFSLPPLLLYHPPLSYFPHLENMINILIKKNHLFFPLEVSLILRA